VYVHKEEKADKMDHLFFLCVDNNVIVTHDDRSYIHRHLTTRVEGVGWRKRVIIHVIPKFFPFFKGVTIRAVEGGEGGLLA